MELDFDKMNGLVPAIIQDNETRKVLMLGFMNKEAYDKTVETGKVTFFSRTKNRLWTKGEESGNFLHVVSIKADCDNDTLLIQVNPVGPVCHTGTDTCWGEKNEEPVMFLKALQDFQHYAGIVSGYYILQLYQKLLFGCVYPYSLHPVMNKHREYFFCVLFYVFFFFFVLFYRLQESLFFFFRFDSFFVFSDRLWREFCFVAERLTNCKDFFLCLFFYFF